MTTLNEPGQIEGLQVQEGPLVTEQNGPISDDSTSQRHRPNAAPNPKRRRVIRACDECRRGKIKCDGKQPCTHCALHSYDCTFDQPSKRRRHVTAQYVEGLEVQLKRAKTFLSIICPALNLENASLDPHLQNAQHQLFVRGLCALQILHDLSVPYGAEGAPSLYLEPTVEPTSQLLADGKAEWIYRNHDAQPRLQQQVQSVVEPPSEGPLAFVRRRPMSLVQDTPGSVGRSVAGPANDVRLPDIDLPPRMVARALCERALLGTSTLVRVVHIPTFNQSIERIYETQPEHYGATDNTFLPLLYAVLALGVILSDETEFCESGYKPSIDEGFKYFRASRQLLHIADCNDLTSLQAIVCMIQFSLSFTRLSTCYAYIGVALRSALHMGLHRSFNTSSSSIETETRKRLFWSIRKMDTYVGTMLGLPIYLSDGDADQDWPIEVDDECITEIKIYPMPDGRISVLAASNAHTRIIQIFAKICKYVYPIKGPQSDSTPSVTGTVSYSKIIELENDLQKWLCDLPSAFKIGGVAAPTYIRLQGLLQAAYCHAQMLLYRPFLHYLSQSNTAEQIDQRAFACANACVSASRNIVRIAVVMKQQELLVAADWLTIYSTFSAVVSIMDLVTENPHNPTSYDSYQDAIEGKNVLAHLAKRSVAAGRCASTLAIMFDRLPDGVKRGAHPTKA